MPTITPRLADSSFWRQLPASRREWLEKRGARPDGPAASPRIDADPLPPEAAAPNRCERRGRAAQERRSKPPPRTFEERDADYLKRLTRKLEAAGALGDVARPRLVPRSEWVMCQAILADRSGRAVRSYFRAEPNKVGIGAIRQAALVPAGEHGTRYTWADERARAIAALGLVMLRMSVPTRRKGIWTSVLRGLPVGVFCKLLRDPFTRRPKARTTITGRHRRGGCVGNGQVGYMRALREVGFCYGQQLHPKHCDPCELVGTSGWATARRWVVGFIPSLAPSDRQMRQMAHWHNEGWDAAQEKPAAMPPPLRRSTAPPLAA